ncbi:MAG TPA: succinate--CoA ligase subunit alpha [Candidatus Mcinerneyibacteriales bacterium]|nr:succinate--CoA ligase subunit alpha [Candidatus Mcinerneyibacteriales bacterium]HPJ70561.1 succinate--CoA ligase subunit alpha [Candidatus Mcinerneyibacteriales bacterium]HPQ88586.1 succinate--CoA ligase subunit alpha [Candidatus Mcinerneyibacteriales bacterium]
MAIFVNRETKVIVQGITGRDGSFHTGKMLEYGTKIVGGVTPFKGGLEVEGVPVFNTVAEAVSRTGADTSIIYIPPAFAAGSVIEAVEAGIKNIVCITEGIPVTDMMTVAHYVRSKGARLFGPNCPGIITPGETKIGIMPGHIFSRGPVGVISRSGTLTYEVVHNLTSAGLGQSTVIGIGGDPIIGTKFVDCLEAFEEDPETKAVVLIGEIGGSDEEMAADYIKKHFSKPVAVFIAGKTAPKGKRMGHAGAIIHAGKGTAESKVALFREAGAVVVDLPVDIAAAVKAFF